jgi:hypothetical protein
MVIFSAALSTALGGLRGDTAARPRAERTTWAIRAATVQPSPPGEGFSLFRKGSKLLILPVERAEARTREKSQLEPSRSAALAALCALSLSMALFHDRGRRCVTFRTRASR